MLRLPRSLRSEFKEPFGPVYADAESLLDAFDDGDGDADGDDARAPLVAVGDVVTAHLVRVGRIPDVAVVDGRTEREAVSPATEEALESLPPGIEVDNPAGELTEALLRALREALESTDVKVVDVDGEEDLATLPAVVAAPDGAGIVYGQPGEGMVLVRVTPETRREMVELLGRFEGDVNAALALLDGESERRRGGNSR